MSKDKQNKTPKNTSSFINEHMPEVIAISGAISIALLSYWGYKYITKSTVTSIQCSPTISKSSYSNGTTIKNTVEPIIENQLPRYVVQFKAFKTSNWYNKTKTNYINSAYSVASCNSYGRAYRIIDTKTNTILKETLEDASMAIHNGYPNGYPWK